MLATTARRGFSGVIQPREAAERAVLHAARGGKIAFLFGNEKTGLSEAEHAWATLHVRIPMAAAQPSVNLAQATQIIAYELFVAALGARRRVLSRCTAMAIQSRVAAQAAHERSTNHRRLAFGHRNEAEPAMREAMANAMVGDDVYGEDPTVIELERPQRGNLGQRKRALRSLGHHGQPNRAVSAHAAGR